MADVTGPISTLPGAKYPTPVGMKCDHHQDRLAIQRVQGETDSMGSEMHDLCAECFLDFFKEDPEERIGICGWCKKPATDLRDRRDWEEGSCGPVYRVCGECVRKENEEFDRMRAEDPTPDDWYDVDDGAPDEVVTAPVPHDTLYPSNLYWRITLENIRKRCPKGWPRVPKDDDALQEWLEKCGFKQLDMWEIGRLECCVPARHTESKKLYLIFAPK